MGRVGILGPRSDELESVARLVQKCGGVPVLIDAGQSGWASDGLRMVLHGQSLDDIGVFYVKGIPLALTIPEISASGSSSTWLEQYAIERERHALLHSTLRGLELDGRLFVNSVIRFDLHIFKLYQSTVLSRSGVLVPISLGTDDLHAASKFASAHANIAVKPLSGGTLVKRMSSDDWRDAQVGMASLPPTLLQEYIDGDEYRVYVLDGEPIVAFSIPTDGVADARERLHEATRCTPKAAVLDVAARAAVALDLVFTAVDIRVAKDGRIVVLECNPTPAMGFHDKEGIVLRHLAEFLVMRS